MDSFAMPRVPVGSSASWPALGLGTWRMGEDAARRVAELAAVRQALDIGYRLFDTAEMYGDGGAESVLGEALQAAWRSGIAREQVVVVSKVYPHNASPRDMAAACERSLRRLRLQQIDLYLLHWRGPVPLAATVEGFQALQRRGWIRHWGVSNFDLSDLHELDAVPGGATCAANQVYYSLSQRGIEHDLLPAQTARRLPLMAYSPIDQGALDAHPLLRGLADGLGITPAQLALAWVLSRPGVMAVPKAVHPLHLQQNWAAAHWRLSAAQQADLDRLFPPPQRRQPLAMR